MINEKIPTNVDPSPRTLEHGMEEDVGSGGNVFRFSAFDLVMADTVFTGDEDHSSRDDMAHLAGIMSCP